MKIENENGVLTFEKIVREGKLISHSQGDPVVIYEKLDGANASFGLFTDEEGEVEFSVRSRNSILNIHKALHGWFGYAHEKIKPTLWNLETETSIVDDLIFYGEWLIKHKVAYKPECYKEFYLFAVYSSKNDRYFDNAIVEHWANILNLKMAPILYKGEFTKVGDYQDLVGKSEMTLLPNTGEGIVIFNMNPDNQGGRLLSRTKWVSQAFSEVSGHKVQKVTELVESAIWMNQFLTDSRIDKAIMKLEEEGNLPEIKFANFGNIARPVIEYVYKDVLDEEGDSKPELFDEAAALKSTNKRVPIRVRLFIQDNEEVVTA